MLQEYVRFRRRGGAYCGRMGNGVFGRFYGAVLPNAQVFIDGIRNSLQRVYFTERCFKDIRSHAEHDMYLLNQFEKY